MTYVTMFIIGLAVGCSVGFMFAGIFSHNKTSDLYARIYYLEKQRSDFE